MKKKFIKKFAFTLAEIMIVLGIIGIVAETTIPTLIHDFNEQVYKTAYKKAYSDLSQIFITAISERSLIPRTAGFDPNATTSEWNLIKDSFKAVKICTGAQINECWADAEKLLGLPDTSCPSMIDVSGRSWALYSSGENLYLVDTNGLKKPNQYGKDRWMFTLWNSDNSRVGVGLPAKVGIFENYDTFGVSWTCGHPPCYYKSWLFGP